MPFVYRLQKILDFRIRKKEEQLLVVQKAQQEVFLAEQRIRENEAEIQQTIQNKKTADFKMMEYYDKYLHHRDSQLLHLSALPEQCFDLRQPPFAMH